jgi:hypothetical protein
VHNDGPMTDDQLKIMNSYFGNNWVFPLFREVFFESTMLA